MTNTQNVEELQPRMTRETLVSLARKAAVYLPTASAQLMNELATRLDVTSVALCESMEQRRNLTAENLALRTPENWLKHSDTGNAAVAIADGNGETEEASLLAGMKAIIACIESPETEAVMAEVRASGVDAAIEHLHKKFEGTGSIGLPVMALEWLAHQLRQGAAS